MEMNSFSSPWLCFALLILSIQFRSSWVFSRKQMKRMNCWLIEKMFKVWAQMWKRTKCYQPLTSEYGHFARSRTPLNIRHTFRMIYAFDMLCEELTITNNHPYNTDRWNGVYKIYSFKFVRLLTYIQSKTWMNRTSSVRWQMVFPPKRGDLKFNPNFFETRELKPLKCFFTKVFSINYVLPFR